MAVVSYIGSVFFVMGTFAHTMKKMRYLYLCGALVFCFVFAFSGLDNGVNLSNFILNAFNVAVHLYNLTKENRERRKQIKLHDKVIAFDKVA